MPQVPGPFGSCCSPCDDVVTTNVPGPTGATGAAGADGSDGVNAYTTTTAAFTMPAAAATVNVAVADTSWMGVGQYLFIETAGIMKVSSITTSSLAVLENTGADINAAAATSIASGKKVSPGGPEGSASVAGEAAGGDLTGTYPNPTLAIPATTGDILVGDSGAPTLVSKGTDGKFLQSNSALGGAEVGWAKVDLSNTASVDNQLAIGSGGTGQATQTAAMDALSPTTTKGDIMVDDGTNVVRLAVGANGTVPIADSAETKGIRWGSVFGSSAQYTYQEAQNVDGDNIASGTGWATVPLSNEVYDDGNIGSLAASQVTLNSGTYRFRYRFCLYKNVASTLDLRGAGRLYNASVSGAISGSESIVSYPSRDEIEELDYVEITREGRFTLASNNQLIELQAYKSISGSNDVGYGKALNIQSEIYAVLTLEKE